MSVIWRDLLLSRPKEESEPTTVRDPDDEFRDNIALGVFLLLAGAVLMALAGLGVIH